MTSGHNNVLIGNNAGGTSVSGAYNVMFGTFAGFSTQGDKNVMLGYAAGHDETGSEKLYIENSSADETETLIWGDFANDLLRFNAGVGIGAAPIEGYSLRITATTAQTRGVNVIHDRSETGTAYAGYFDLDNNSGGSAYGVRSFSTSNTSSSSTYGFYGTADGTSTGGKYGVRGYAGGSGTRYGVYGAGANYGVYASGNLAYTGAFINASDEKFKQDIKSSNDVLSKVMQVKSRTYTYKTDVKFSDMIFSDGIQHGFVAQELEEVFPELVVDAVHPGETDPETGEDIGEEIKYKGVKYLEMIPILLKAIQEQQEIIEKQGEQIEALKVKMGMTTETTVTKEIEKY